MLADIYLFGIATRVIVVNMTDGGDNTIMKMTATLVMLFWSGSNAIATTEPVDFEKVKQEIFKQQLEFAGYSENDPAVIVLPKGTKLPLYPGLPDTKEGRDSYKKLTAQLLKNKHEMQLKGYHSEETNRPRELLQLHKIIHLEYESQAKNIANNPLDTHMKHTVGEVGLAYDFKPVPTSDVTNLIGFAAMGGYVSSGWGGIGEFFDNATIGSCVYSENNVKFSHARAKFTEDDVTYDINNKVTVIDVKGTKSSGFLYSIDWYDNNFFRQLECANMKYSKTITNAVIELASRIDKQ